MAKYECGLATQAIHYLESGQTDNFAYAVRLSLPHRGEHYPKREFNALLNRVRRIAVQRKGCRELILQASPWFIKQRFAKAEQRAAKRREKSEKKLAIATPPAEKPSLDTGVRDTKEYSPPLQLELTLH